MLKYLVNLKNRFFHLKNGMELHPTSWTGQAETPTTVDANMASIDQIQLEIVQKEDELSILKSKARSLESELELVADTIENKAIGFHTTEPEVLVDYDIKLRKPREKKPVPTTVITPELKDDYDGQGFIITIKVDPLADKYEWEKGVADDPKDLNTIPAMSHFKITSKTSFVDDEVAKGVRYFYRVRALNSTGNGPWSAAISRVQ